MAAVAPTTDTLVLEVRLEVRLRAMAQRWRYTQAELLEVLELARLDPDRWVRAVALDEMREDEFIAQGLIQKVPLTLQHFARRGNEMFSTRWRITRRRVQPGADWHYYLWDEEGICFAGAAQAQPLINLVNQQVKSK